MTVVVSSSPSEPPPTNIPPHVEVPRDPQAARLSLLESIHSARRIVVVLGAGISTACGIPDFRSANGLFASPAAGKDLFDAHLFSDSTGSSQARYYKMIASLRQSADAAPPSPFHRLLKRLDDQGKLSRVYTQNIDALEHKAGLSYGLSLDSAAAPSTTSKKQPSAKQCRARTPRVVPLHGNTLSLVCSRCSFREDLSLHLPLLTAGQTAECSQCIETNKKRAAASERSRGIGLMLPDVLLYNDHHHADAATLGSILRADLTGPRPDLLLVVGTSLKVPGTKRLVRELCKFSQRRPATTSSTATNNSADCSANDEASSDKRRSKKAKKFHTVFINSDWPIASSEWKDAFDIWYKGDCQSLIPQLDELSLQKERAAEAKLRAKANREAKARNNVSSSCSSPLLLPISSQASSTYNAADDFLSLPALSQSSSTTTTSVSTVSSHGSYAYDYYDPPSSLTSDIDDVAIVTSTTPHIPFEVAITSPSKAPNCRSQALTQYFQTTKASPKKRSSASRKL